MNVGRLYGAGALKMAASAGLGSTGLSAWAGVGAWLLRNFKSAGWRSMHGSNAKGRAMKNLQMHDGRICWACFRMERNFMKKMIHLLRADIVCACDIWNHQLSWWNRANTDDLFFSVEMFRSVRSLTKGRNAHVRRHSNDPDSPICHLCSDGVRGNLCNTPILQAKGDRHEHIPGHV